MPLIPSKELVRRAEREIQTWSAEQSLTQLDNPDVQFVDIRDIRELQKLGTIPGAFHAPRGMLEFWVDPDSPYAQDIFQSGQTFLLFCGSGWRSALAAKSLQDMGFDNVAHIGGGFTAWTEAGGRVENSS